MRPLEATDRARLLEHSSLLVRALRMLSVLLVAVDSTLGSVGDLLWHSSVMVGVALGMRNLMIMRRRLFRGDDLEGEGLRICELWELRTSCRV